MPYNSLCSSTVGTPNILNIIRLNDSSVRPGKAKWTRAAVDHLLSNSKYIVVVGFESFADVQFEKSARCNVDLRQGRFVP